MDFSLLRYLGHLIVKFMSSKATEANKELPVLYLKETALFVVTKLSLIFLFPFI